MNLIVGLVGILISFIPLCEAAFFEKHDYLEMDLLTPHDLAVRRSLERNENIWFMVAAIVTITGVII